MCSSLNSKNLETANSDAWMIIHYKTSVVTNFKLAKRELPDVLIPQVIILLLQQARGAVTNSNQCYIQSGNACGTLIIQMVSR